MRIAMWSGPRNLSTAMMYAFGNRADFAIWDEPFYAPYLSATGIDHPMYAEILAAHESDPDKVAARCIGPIPGGKPHFYMKHMPLHMIDGFPLDWAADCVNVHLLRHPARVVASYAAKRENPTLDDIGFRQQVELFARFPGLVIDSADIRADPEGMLRALCAEIGLAFDPAMLHWPAGPRAEDGVWAAHWYGAVHRSTGFAGAEGPLPQLEGTAAALAEAALPYYEELAAKRILPG
ncbi:sulfotransferase-like domain-containing protein [Pseudodonghicola flavimaris]|uniref:HAD family hydrolase n=1 Tax=Pseudodonghicola flavimaris TaxID=3050036 RepID=A0ABT7EZU3_9RHOB|nr:HAD family hydrolase [Pseudodonghicola flavimaris]MDK3017872.1 HAD family hydrolase [Pseudodonghicola flavimaris]